MKTTIEAWVCESCGEPAEGELCRHCGHPHPVPDPGYPRAGTMGSLYGLPQTPLAGRFAMLLWLLPALLGVIAWALIGYARRSP